MLNKKWVLIAALVLGVLAMAACGGGAVQTIVVTEIIEGEPVEVVVTVPPEVVEEPPQDTIIICMSQEPDTLYQMAADMAVTVQVAHASHMGGWYYDTAFWYETRGLVDNAFPTFESGDVVIEGEGSDAVLSVTYRFKPEITWSDGEPFTVDDILFTREVVIDPDSTAATRGLLAEQTFEKIDDYTLKVSYPAGQLDPTYFLPPLSSAQGNGGDALPEHVLGGMTPAEIAESDFPRLPNPVLGPYEYVEWVEGDHITMKAVDGWWGGEIKTPNVVYRVITDTNQVLASLLSGDCDYATNDTALTPNLPFIQQSAEKGLIKYDAIPSLVWEHVDMNTHPAPGAETNGYAFFADVRTRQAVAYGTNRLEMTEQIFFGEVQPLNSYLPSDHWAYNTALDGAYPFDPDQAKALLAEVGWVDENGDGVLEAPAGGINGEFSCDRGSYTIPAGTPFEVSFHTTTGNAMRAALSPLFQSYMADIGIKINLDLLPASVWFGDDGPLTQRTFQIGEYAFVAGPDPTAWGVYSGMNVYKTPDGEFLVASVALEANPALLDGMAPVEGFDGGAEEWFKWGRPTQEELPEGYSKAANEQIAYFLDTDAEGSNNPGWCDEQATQLLFNADNVIDPQERLPFFLEFQLIYSEQVPAAVLFQRLEIEAGAVDLCGPVRGPANYSSWNVQEWYFGDCAE